MASLLKFLGVASALIVGTAAASFPPSPDELDVTVVKSKVFDGASISYKETNICETTKGVKGYSGYVNLPPSPEDGRPYPIHNYFWFFEAREKSDEAPLSLWLQGGPGAPSVVAALGENGPCSVNDDSKTTTLNPWSWNNKANMLYIDQPVQVGFSYDVLTNGTIDEVSSPFIVDVKTTAKNGVPETNLTYITGTFASQDLQSAPNTTLSAARAMWQVMQVWMQEFPEYKAEDDKFSIWAESYGGHYGPTFADYFTQQNSRIESGEISSGAKKYEIETLGLMNACIDIETQMPLYPEYAVNNTYGIQTINETAYKAAAEAVPQCLSLAKECRSLADSKDPEGLGNSKEVNKACSDAFKFCFGKVNGAFQASGLYQFDIATSALGSFPPKWPAGYLNTREIQEALGVPVNFTGNSFPVAASFDLTGDFVRGSNLEILGKLVDQGVKVALVYGDRDFQCNWLGGEQISLAVKSDLSSNFKSAGYANISTNADYTGGVVRQVGDFSFVRIFDAGHEAPHYQPETAYQIFNRVMSGQDVATGEVAVDERYASKGPESSFGIKNKKPEPRAVQCYFWDMMETCTPAQKMMFLNGTAITENFILVGYKDADGNEVFLDGGSGAGNGADGSGAGGGPGSSGDPRNGGSCLGAGYAVAVAVAGIGLQLTLF